MTEGKEFSIRLVLGDEPYNCPPLIPAIVAKMKGGKKDFPVAYQFIHKISKRTQNHLKRVKELSGGEFEFFLCPLEENEDFNIQVEHIKNQLDNKELFYDYRITSIPSKAPRTFEQLEACKDIWPCKFAKDDYLIKCMVGNWLHDWEKRELEIIAGSLIGYLKDNSGPIRKSGAVIFRNALVRGVGLSNTVGNLLHHAPMLAVDDVSKSNGGGHYNLTNGNEFKDILQSKLDEEPALTEHKRDIGIVPYLCTKYDIFVTEEPCFMCSFALIESRIRRLYYLDASPISCHGDKAIEKFQVHLDRRFNHRFEACRVKSLS